MGRSRRDKKHAETPATKPDGLTLAFQRDDASTCALYGTVQVNGFAGHGFAPLSYHQVQRFESELGELARTGQGAVRIEGRQGFDGGPLVRPSSLRVRLYEIERHKRFGVQAELSSGPHGGCDAEEIHLVRAELKISGEALRRFAIEFAELIGSGPRSEVLLYPC